MNKRLEFVVNKFSVKSEKDLTEEQLIEYAKTREAGIQTNISIERIIDLINAYKDYPDFQPDMKKVCNCLKKSIRQDADFVFGVLIEGNERYSYDIEY